MRVVIRLNEDEIGPSIMHGIPQMKQFMEGNHLELTRSHSSYSELELEYETIKEEEPLVMAAEAIERLAELMETNTNVHECEQDKSESNPIF